MDNYLAIEHDLAEHNADTSFDPPFPDAEPYAPEHRKHLAPEVQAHHAKLDAEYAEEPEDGGYEYAKYDDTVPASLDEDGTLPEYSIYARYWPSPDEKKDRKPVQYSKLACGHKLRGSGFEPNHRNCERCWFTYFQVNGQLTQAVEEAFQTGGPELIKRLKGPKFLDNFLKFMSTVALIKAQQEAAKPTISREDAIAKAVAIEARYNEGIARSGGTVASTEGEEGASIPASSVTD